MVGTDVRVAAGFRTVRGDIQSVTADSLVVESANGRETFTRQKITRVSVRKKGHRLRNTLIGFGAGTGVGIAIGAVDASGCKELLCGLAPAVGAILGAIGGTIAGAVWPTGGWRDVYKQ
jgi:hypothetical protein